MSEAHRVRAAIEAEPWLITAEALETIRLVAERLNDPEAISKFAVTKHAGELTSIVGESTAVMNIVGPLTRYASVFSNISAMTSTEIAASEFAALDAMPNIKRIVLQFDTPGGMANGISEFASMIKASSTPVVSYVSGMCCSAGYWLASMTDFIVVNDTSVTGSIGVRGSVPSALDESEVLSSNAPNKNLSREAYQSMIDKMESQFISAVADGRNVTADHVRSHFGKGGVFVGSDAVEAGLADATGTLDSVLSAGITTALKATTKESTMHSQPSVTLHTEATNASDTENDIPPQTHAEALDAAEPTSDEGIATAIAKGVSMAIGETR